MLDPSGPTPIWVVWPYLGSLERLLFITLVVLGLYVLFSAVITLLRVRKAGACNGDSPDLQKIFATLRKRSTRVEKLITTAFYLFGCVLFMGLLNAYSVIDDSKIPTGYIVLAHLEPHFAFAANMFFVLLALHLIGWFISCSVGRGLSSHRRTGEKH